MGKILKIQVNNGDREIVGKYNNLTGYDTIIISSEIVYISDSFNCCSATQVIFETKDSYPYGVREISESFNSGSIERLSIPRTTSCVKTSFNSCNLSNLAFDVQPGLKYKQYINNGNASIMITESFNKIPIEKLTICPRVVSILSSFRQCENLSNLTIETFSDYFGTYGVNIISPDSFLGSQLSNVRIPLTVKGINRFNFQAKPDRFSFSKKVYSPNQRGVIATGSCILDSDKSTASFFIYRDGSFEEDYTYYSDQQREVMNNMLFKLSFPFSICHDYLDVLDSAKKIANKEKIVSILINGNTCNVFLPTSLSETQRKTLLELIKRMNEKQNEYGNNVGVNEHSKSFKIHICYNNYYYDKLYDDYIGLRDFVSFLIAFGIFEENDFDLLEVSMDDGKNKPNSRH